MGIRKKCSRLITVDGVLYRYRVTEERDGLPLNIGVQQVDPAGQRLITHFERPISPHTVAPQVIRKLILAALSKDWHPAASGDGFFSLKADQVVPYLPNPD